MDAFTWTIAALGGGTLIGVFVRMTPGFGPFTVRIIAIVLAGTLATLLAVRDSGALNAAMGIPGAIVGYVAGLKDKGGCVLATRR